jgi:hypothetical protein
LSVEIGSHRQAHEPIVKTISRVWRLCHSGVLPAVNHPVCLAFRSTDLQGAFHDPDDLCPATFPVQNGRYALHMTCAFLIQFPPMAEGTGPRVHGFYSLQIFLPRSCLFVSSVLTPSSLRRGASCGSAIALPISAVSRPADGRGCVSLL